MKESIPSKEYIDYICSLYGDVYDDRIEDSKPPTAGAERREAGSDWVPGQVADHKSLGAFRKELEEMGIKLSTSKIKKILVSGGCWTTERSREIGRLFGVLTKTAEVVYKLEKRSKNAVRCERWRKNGKGRCDTRHYS